MEEELFDIEKFFDTEDIESENEDREESEEETMYEKKEDYTEDEDEEDENNYLLSDIPENEYLLLKHENFYNPPFLSDFEYLVLVSEKAHKPSTNLENVKEDNEILPKHEDIYEEDFDSFFDYFEDEDTTIIQYQNPVLMDYSHGPFVSQQIEMKNRTNIDVTAYEITMKSKDNLGIKSEYSEEFGGMYITEINGIKDGQDGNWWEFYVRKPDGSIEIGKDSIDKTKLEPGENIEWRLASEEPGGCGGGSSENSIYKNEKYKTKSESFMRFRNDIFRPYPLMNN